MPRLLDFNKLLVDHTVQQLIEKGIKRGPYKNFPTHLVPSVHMGLEDDITDVLYVPTIKQQEFHGSLKPNCLLEGPRGTGKSVAIRFDAHMRALSTPNFTYLIIRRTTPELKKSHLRFISAEMKKFGGFFHKTDNQAHYPNGSVGFFAHCEHDDDVLKLLSSEYGAIYFDEWTTFPWDMVQMIAACARVEEDSGLMAVIRGGTNPLGPGAGEVKKHFITKKVDFEKEPDYIPEDWHAIHTNPHDNPHIDWVQYTKQLKNLPEHVRRAWLDGEWIDEGAYFADFRASIGGKPWHVISSLPTVIVKDREGNSLVSPLLRVPWINIYRCLDWGYHPDPAVCIWVAVLPDGSEIAFKERWWKQTLAANVAKGILRESEDFSRALETFADPSIFAKRGETVYSVGELIEQNRVPLTQSLNDRQLFGYAIHDHLNTLIDGHPKLTILDSCIVPGFGRLGCPELIRTIPEMRMDSKDPSKLAEGEDHFVISLAYYCIGEAPPSQEPEKKKLPRWMRPRPVARHRYLH